MSTTGRVATIVAGVPSKNLWLYRRIRFKAGDPAALRLAAERLLADPADLTANAPTFMLGDRRRAAEERVQRQARDVGG